MISKHNEEIELEANFFAFFGLLTDEELYSPNIIDLTINKGIPRNIALQIWCTIQMTI